MTRKVLYNLPIIILMLILLPAGGVLAAPVEGAFEVNGAPYSSLAAAVAAVTTNAQTVIQAEKPSTADAAITIPAEKNIVLDLNGQTVTLVGGTTANQYDLTNRGTLTIRDTTADKLGVLTGGIGVVSNTRTGIMTMESGTLKSMSTVANYSVTVSNAGKLTVDGGTIYNPGFRAIDCQNYTEINGGLIHTEGTGGYNRAAIAITASDAMVELHGGEIRGVLYGVSFSQRDTAHLKWTAVT